MIPRVFALVRGTAGIEFIPLFAVAAVAVVLIHTSSVFVSATYVRYDYFVVVVDVVA